MDLLEQQIIDKHKEIGKLVDELNALVQQQIDISQSLVGKYVILDGEKGWNKGKIDKVWGSLSHPRYGITPQPVRVNVRHGASAAKTTTMDKLREMTPEEIQQYEKSLEIDRKINERAERHHRQSNQVRQS